MWQLSCTKYVVARKGEEVYSILQLLVSFTKLLTFEVRCCWLQYFRKFIINFESYVYQSRSWGTRNFSFPICNVLSPVSLGIWGKLNNQFNSCSQPSMVHFRSKQHLIISPASHACDHQTKVELWWELMVCFCVHETENFTESHK